MAPLFVDAVGRVGLRPDAAIQAIVIVALASTSFDGLSRTRFWIDLTRNISPLERNLLSTVALVWAMSVATLVFVGAMRVTGRLHRRRFQELTASFVHSLVPIALAYDLTTSRCWSSRARAPLPWRRTRWSWAGTCSARPATR